MNKQVYIVTPAYNNENFVNRTFSCLKNQTYTNWKWVVVDDGSEDTTLQRLIEFSAMDNRVIVKKNLGNKGAGGARNFGLKFVDGNLLTFIDADDEWNPNFLEIMVQKVLKPNSMAFGGYKRKYPNSENIFIPTKKISFTDLFRGSDISCLTAIYHFANNSEIPKFGEIRARNDLIFNLRVLQVIDYAEPVSEVLATYHIQKRSISRNKFKLIYWQYYVSRSFQRSIILSIKDVIHWAFYGLKKYQIFNFYRTK